MPSVKINGRMFDARPDRVDIRDREYSPRLVNLPPQFPSEPFIQKQFKAYADAGLVLDQMKEGACTGFGLAAVVNYLLWKQAVENGGNDEPTIVSARMLYQLARMYDEWPGEDYDGSSCRGAMKGWHKHGVCTRAVWPYLEADGVTPGRAKEQWAEEASQRPLGAYYRVNYKSIVDLQSAIVEVGAVYVSANVHNGWMSAGRMKPWGGQGAIGKLPIIGRKKKDEETGGHAFALVGYCGRGFIVQNSWGVGWGLNGFAILPYEEWVENGMDAWVAAMGSPMEVDEPAKAFTEFSVAQRANGAAFETDGAGGETRKTEPLNDDEAYKLTVITGNNGRPINQFIDCYSAQEAVRRVVFDEPKLWLGSRGTKRVVLYAHGGLNDEKASVRRVRVMAPYFLANDIYPIFITWKSGVWESITGQLRDKLGLDQIQGGWWDSIKNAAAEVRDRTIELLSEHVLVRSLWSEMKQNAALGVAPNGGLRLMVDSLRDLDAAMNGIELHAMGHSAGSIVLGHVLDAIGSTNLKVKTCRLMAAACTVPFAAEKYGSALETGRLQSLKLDVMSDERERADTVGAYGKSLLYLVSRALEDLHKTPLLGMEASWRKDLQNAEEWNREFANGPLVQHTKRLSDGGTKLVVYNKGKAEQRDYRGISVEPIEDHEYSPTGGKAVALAHGSFDNDIEVIADAIKDILKKKPGVPVTNLEQF